MKRFKTDIEQNRSFDYHTGNVNVKKHKTTNSALVCLSFFSTLNYEEKSSVAYGLIAPTEPNERIFALYLTETYYLR